MKFKVFIFTILVIIAVLIPAGIVFADTTIWTGTAQATVNEPLVVVDSDGSTILANGATMATISLNRGDTIIKKIYVRNTSATTDFTVTPSCQRSTTNISCISPATKAIAKGSYTDFDFTLTGVRTGPPATISFSFSSNFISFATLFQF